MKSHASMNRIYRLVWNHTLGVMVAVAENAKGRGKSSTSRGLVAGAVALTGGLFLTPFAQAGPTGGQVSAGSGTIAQSGLNTTINQSSQNLAINWQGFSIAANESVRFNQPNTSSIALNRVIGQDPSQILGSLSANGQVFVINPNGVLFGANAQVNVGGLVATTLSLSDSDLMAGRYVFDSSSRSVDGAVVNKGSLTAAQGGYIALLAPEVRNEGVISATLGTALLAAGNKVTLNLNSGSLLGFSIDQGAINALADNKQLIQADGGQVFMSAKAADALSTAVVNNTGIIQARTVQNVAGVIKLMGDMDHGTVHVGGTLDASAPTGGNGGFVETSAAHVKVADSAKVTTLAANGLNGTWLIDPVDFTIAATGGDMTGAAVTSALSGGNFTILSSNGTHGGTAGDINVNDAVSWSANKLTLNAQNNININAAMTATSTASLALEFGQGAVEGGNTSNIVTGAAGVVNLPASTTNFTTKQGSDGLVKTYTVITDLGAENSTTTDLQGMKGNLAGNYVLGANIDASATGTWSAGFAPVGYDYYNHFTGTFDGLGHTINKLTINLPNTNYVGLFGYAGTDSVIRNVRLTGGNVTGSWFTGALAGASYGSVSNSHSNATVFSSGSYVGGLVGVNGGTISNSDASGVVNATGGTWTYDAGGLVGLNNGTVSNSHAEGTVNATGYDVGGLVGLNNRTVNNSYVRGGSVSGSGSVGGLVGNGTATNSHYDIDAVSINGATGVISTGGLYNTNGTGQFNDWLTTGTLNIANYSSTLSGSGNSYTLSSVQGMKDLLGFADNSAYTFTLTNNLTLTSGLYIPYLAGTFDGGNYTISGLNLSGGSKIGLIGTAASGSQVKNVALSGGKVSGGNYVGALVGYNSGTITNSSSTNGTVSSSTGYDVGGLVGRNYYSATITNSYATGSVTGSTTVGNYIGGLVGRNYGTVSNSHAAGSVTGNYGVGGLVGFHGGGSINNSYVSSSSVVGKSNVGGLTGVTRGGTLSNSHYDIDAVTINGSSAVGQGGLYNTAGTGQFNDWLTHGSLNIANYSSTLSGSGNNYTLSSVQGMKDLLGFADNAAYTFTLSGNIDLASAPAGFYIPYLAGTFDGANHTISNFTVKMTAANNVGLFGETATGSTITRLGLIGANVTGADTVGGLVGRNNGTISNSYVTGSVSGGSYVGGLVGQNYNTISNSYATSHVTGTGYWRIGGLVGMNQQSSVIRNSYATGDVTGGSASSVGGLVGILNSNSQVSNSYATGNVTSTGNKIGGLVGSSYGGASTVISNSYSSGHVTGSGIGGLVGSNGATVSNSFWNTETSGTTSSAGGTGLTTAQMQTGANFSSATASNGNVNPNWDMAGTWIVYDGHTAPLLRSFMTDLTVTASDFTTTYSGQNYATSGVTYSVTPNANLLGSLFAGATNVGTYTAGGLYSNQQGYIVKYVGGTLTINKADLVLSGSRTYDTTTTVAGSALTATGMNHETFTMTGAGDASNLTSKNVQTGSTLASLTGLTLGSSANGGLSSNYNALSTTGSSINITKANLAVTGLSANGKTYDTSAIATLTGTAAVTALGTDSITLGGTATGSFANKNVGTNKAVTVTGNTLSGLDAGNYNLVQQTGITATITKADLAMTGLAASSKTYDAGTVATLTGTAAVTALGTDSVTLGGTASGSFANKNVGTGKAVTVTGNTLTGTDAGNYNLVQQTGLSADISKADLAVTGLSASSKTYDAGTVATLTGTAAVTALGTDSVTLGGTASGSFANKNVGTGKAVTVTGNTLSGLDAGNYNLVQQTGLSADISKADLAVTGLAASSKTYDATAAATLTGTASVSALMSDQVTLSGIAKGVFADKNIGTNIAVTVSGNTLSGLDAGNYKLVQQTGLKASITRPEPIVTASPASDQLDAVQVTLAQEVRKTDKVVNAINPDKPQNQQGSITVVNDGQRLPEGVQPLSAL